MEKINFKGRLDLVYYKICFINFTDQTMILVGMSFQKNLNCLDKHLASIIVSLNFRHQPRSVRYPRLFNFNPFIFFSKFK